jgi:HEPN domain-containing protein
LILADRYFVNEKTINNWIELARYDLETASAMLDSGRYLYVAFTCQQAIEKLLKSLFVKKHNCTPPYTHNLIRLCEGVGLMTELSESRLAFIEQLCSYYIQSRYSEELQSLSSALTQEKTSALYSAAKELFAWLSQKI